MAKRYVLILAFGLGYVAAVAAERAGLPPDPLGPPVVGAAQLNILSPTMLELSLVTTKAKAPARVTQWDFVDDTGKLRLPDLSAFSVTAGGQAVPVHEVGFRRRVIYAPLQPRDLRIGNSLYLRLLSPIPDGQSVEVKNPKGDLWQAPVQFTASADPHRYSPVIHVNQDGYVPAFPKTAIVGYFLGSLRELEVLESARFKLLDAETGEEVFSGPLGLRRDAGFPATPPPYQRVLQADFTEFKNVGTYRVSVPGLGASAPFVINDGVAAAVARSYALGLYHQRCGTSNSLPFTRFVHAACHTAPATIPTANFGDAQKFLAESSSDYKNNPRHTAPQMKTFNSGLYPYVKHGTVDVSGGHHDAGDYSKYTINSAGLVHAMVFSADALPGAGELDNLGLPESGDGKSDLLQEAKWEADFLARMQDEDGGFYFLVYPRNRRYENDVPPDRGDRQIVWPKNTSATAAAVAALAQISASPLFKKQFPEAAAGYRTKALAGWRFLSAALAKYGRDGSYQKLTHYGDDFMHDDELAWAACELFLATGEEDYGRQVKAWLNPADPDKRRWGWWRLYESYGRAIRSYAYGARTGRLSRDKLDAGLLRKCEAELIAAADDALHWSQQSAYGTSFPSETKRFGGGGWYFSLDQAFDMVAAFGLDFPELNDPRPKYLQAILGNLNYELGCNPVNVCYLTGLGWKRQREIVHHYAMTDRRVLPPDGIPIGNIQAGFMWLDNYQDDLKKLSFPTDETGSNSYPLYDRWSDSFNVQTEFVVVNQARGLGTAAFLMARTPLKSQAWKPVQATITYKRAEAVDQKIVASLTVPDLPLAQATIVWEAEGQQPAFGQTYTIAPGRSTMWIEAEACWPDGRRAFAATNVTLRSN